MNSDVTHILQQIESGDERTIFLNAIEQDDPLALETYLSEACGADKRLRASVDALVRANDQPNHPLDRPPVAIDKGLWMTQGCDDVKRSLIGPVIGTTIGPYRLMEQIGEGGFGLVFVAQQEQPVRRSVALKIVKPGSGSKEIIARFEAERQAVAMMDHPNIARVFDAGVSTDTTFHGPAAVNFSRASVGGRRLQTTTQKRSKCKVHALAAGNSTLGGKRCDCHASCDDGRMPTFLRLT